MKTLTLLTAATLVLAPVAASAIPLPAKTYVMKAGASDMFETESSKLMTGSSDTAVAAFATMMISDHSKSTADVTAAAQSDGLTPGAPMMTPKQKTMIDSLKRTSGSQRDMLYKKQQLVAHREALMLHKQYAASGDKPALKSAAGQIVPVVEHHLTMVKDMTPGHVKAQ